MTANDGGGQRCDHLRQVDAGREDAVNADHRPVAADPKRPAAMQTLGVKGHLKG